ncbi:MAG: O-antigen ligase family protein [Oscillospiraceae bacterium]
MNSCAPNEAYMKHTSISGRFLKGKYTADQKISISVIAIVFVRFIATTCGALWNCMHLPGQSLVLYLTCAICGLIALPGIIAAFSKHFKVMIGISAAFLMLCIMTVAFFPQNPVAIINNTALRFLVFGALSVTLIISIGDLTTLWAMLRKVSYGIALLGVLYYLAALEPIGVYSMPFAYVMLIPLIVLLFSFFKEHKWYDLVIPFFLLLMILARGSRGALISIIAAVVMILFNFLLSKKIREKMKKTTYVFLWIIIIVGIILLVANIEKVLTAIGIVLSKLGMDGRTVALFSSGDIFHSSGRDYITDIVSTTVASNPFAAHGIYGTGVAVNDFMQIGIAGEYAHNIILELIFTFGIVGGAAMLAAIAFIIVFGLIKSKENDERKLIILFIAIGLFPLFISEIVWTSMTFWMLIGIMCKVIHDRYRKTHRKKLEEY